MTKSTSVVLAGLLVLAGVAVIPVQQASGEGGARRDVVRHATGVVAANMEALYLVEFEVGNAGTQLSREQAIERLDKFVIPTLESLRKNSQVRAGGTTGTFTGTFVVGAKSKDEVTEFVRALPAGSIMQWKITKLESFAQQVDLEKKALQSLRSQK
jgi:hypothetical protein